MKQESLVFRNEHLESSRMMRDSYQLVCVDIETNGLFVEDDVLSISVRLLYPDGSPTEDEFFSYINTKQPLNKVATDINKIKQEDIDKAPTAQEVYIKLCSWIAEKECDLPLSPMGHNFLGFDKAKVEKLFGQDKYNRVFHYHAEDSMVLARALQRNRLLPVESCSLKNLALFFRIKHEAHSASSDTHACGQVYSKLLMILKPNTWTRLIRVFVPGYLGVKT